MSDIKKTTVKTAVICSVAALSIASVASFAFAEGGSSEPSNIPSLDSYGSLQNLSYEDLEVEKTYGDDDFINPLAETEVYGEVTYSSSDEDVAMVDEETGEVTILMPGETVITATAAAKDEYAESTASYKLTVKKKPVSIVLAEVEDKTYDGTTVAEVVDIEVDDDELAEGADFEAVGTFSDANVGENKTVNVTLALSNDAAIYYDVDEANFSTNASISAYNIEDAITNLNPEEVTYSGGENKPTVQILAQLNDDNNVQLIEDTDFIVVYPDDMVSAGEKVLTIAGQGNFTGEFEMEYNVEPYSLTASNIVLGYTTVHGDGTAKTPEVTVKIGDFTVNPNEYEVDYEDNEAFGTAKVTVTAKDNMNIDSYAVKTFEITDKDILEISGVENQAVVYTGAPVVLAGNLTVGENDDGITVNDITVTYYDEEGEVEIEQPEEVGSYVVVYSYDGENYVGSLSVEFSITKAESPVPTEMEGLEAESGDSLAMIEGDRTEGFAWVDDSIMVKSGLHTYAAVYTYNDDTDNYQTRTLEVPVRGVARVGVYVEVGTDGGDVEYPDEAREGEEVEIVFVAEDGYEIRQVIVNGIDKTSEVKDGKLVLTAGDKDIEVLVNFRRIYKVLEGDGLDHIVGSNEPVRFRIDANYDLFADGGELYIDGVLVDEKFYTHTQGSTIITLSEEYVGMIGEGNHTVSVAFSDGGVARTNFIVENSEGEAKNDNKSNATIVIPMADSTIVKVPNTGVSTAESAGAKIAGSALAGVGLVGFAVISRKKFIKK
ncbi:Ig-like domain-containing protein [Candidatus Saccharibacteria bacterium]|nr:Ig-like domain-containing protein [Candidatus Saccharibacteria bacterium]